MRSSPSVIRSSRNRTANQRESCGAPPFPLRTGPIIWGACTRVVSGNSSSTHAGGCIARTANAAERRAVKRARGPRARATASPSPVSKRGEALRVARDSEDPAVPLRTPDPRGTPSRRIPPVGAGRHTEGASETPPKWFKKVWGVIGTRALMREQPTTESLVVPEERDGYGPAA
jgi:hypothetical protein